MVNGLEIEQVSVHYGPQCAVDSVDLHIAPGDVVALLGASGSGKSSLLRAIAGLEQPSTGRVRWNGTDMTPVPVHRRGFGLMFQDGQLFGHRTVAGNVAYGLDRWEPAQRRARVTDMLALVGLDGFADRRITTLSGGQAQRVALARALAPKPAVLLLDEPLSALDRGLREHLAGTLSRALRETGTTSLMVTHDQDEAFAVADRVGVMDAGRLVALDTPEGLWRRPGSRLVAEFLGFGPFLPHGEELLGLSATALVPDPDGPLSATVTGRRFRRGRVELHIDLDGQEALVDLSAEEAADMHSDHIRLRVNEAAAVTVPR